MDKQGAPRSGAHLVTVFEAVNETRHEVYVGTSGMLSGQLSETFAVSPPKAVAHWRSGDVVRLRYLTYSIAVKDARAFAARHAAGQAAKGWKIYGLGRSSVTDDPRT